MKVNFAGPANCYVIKFKFKSKCEKYCKLFSKKFGH